MVGFFCTTFLCLVKRIILLKLYLKKQIYNWLWQIFQVLYSFAVEMRSSTHTISPDSGLEEESHCSCTASPALAEEGHLWRKLIHNQCIIILVQPCFSTVWMQSKLKAEMSDHTHQVSENPTQRQVSTLWTPHSDTVFCHYPYNYGRELPGTFSQLFFPIFVTGFLYKIMMGNWEFEVCKWNFIRFLFPCSCGKYTLHIKKKDIIS